MLKIVVFQIFGILANFLVKWTPYGAQELIFYPILYLEAEDYVDTLNNSFKGSVMYTSASPRPNHSWARGDRDNRGVIF